MDFLSDNKEFKEYGFNFKCSRKHLEGFKEKWFDHI